VRARAAGRRPVDVSDTVAVANYRTLLEAELAAHLLEGMQIPYVINSPEGMLYGPLAQGATILVRAEHADLAREVLTGGDGEALARAPGRVARLLTVRSRDEAERTIATLRDSGIPALCHASREGSETDHGTYDIFVRRAHADRALRVLGVAARRAQE
jgi:hypothetical protein